MKKELLLKDTALINACSALSLDEQRLILLAVFSARDNGLTITTSQPLIVRADHYALQYGVTLEVAFQAINNACKNLFEREFRYQKLTEKGNIEHVRSRFISQIGLLQSEAQVRLIFASGLIPMVLALEKHVQNYERKSLNGLPNIFIGHLDAQTP